MTEIDKHLDTIIDSMVDNYPKDEVDEVEFSIRGPVNNDKSPWNLGISQFRSLLKTLKETLKLEVYEPEMMLTIHDWAQRRVRITDLDTILLYCKTDTISPDSMEHVVFETKKRILKPIDFYGLRLRYNSEQVIDDEDEKTKLLVMFRDKKEMKLYRFAKRYSIIKPLKSTEKGKLRLDFTVVRQSIGPDFRAAKIIGPTATRTPELYEVELELLDISRDDIQNEDIQSEIKNVLKIILLHLNGGITIATQEDKLISVQNYVKLCKSVYNQLPAVKITTLAQNMLRDIAPYNISAYISTLDRGKMINKKMQDKTVPYVFTDKADGVRALMYVNNDGKCSLIVKETIKLLKKGQDFLTKKIINTYDKQIASILKVIPTDMILGTYTKLVQENDTVGEDGKQIKGKVGKKEYSFNNSVFDGELLIHSNGNYYYKTFDILIHNSESMMDTDFKERNKLFDIVSETEGCFHVSPKKFIKYTNNLPKFSEFTENLMTEVSESTGEVTSIKIKDNGIIYDLDGLVFQPETGPLSHYPQPQKSGFPSTWKSVYKWKPLHHLSIDLALTYKGKSAPITTRREKTVNSMTIQETANRYAVFTAHSGNSKGDLFMSEYTCDVLLSADSIPRSEEGEPIVKGNIVECRLCMKGRFHWIPVRIRHDKWKPNSEKVYDSTLHSLTTEPITMDNLSNIDGGFGGHPQLTVTKINRNISNEHIIKRALLIKGDIVLFDLACGNAKSSWAWVQIRKRQPSKDVAILGIDAENISKANIIMEANFNLIANKNNKEQYIDKYTFVQADFLKPLHLEASSYQYLTTPERFNIINCAFAIHYALRSKEDFLIFLANVSRNLKSNGVFIGSYMNKTKVLDLFRNRQEDHKQLLDGVKISEDNTSVYAELGMIKGSDIMWKIKKTYKGDLPGVFDNNSIAIDFMGLYKNNQEYLIDLEDPDIISLMKQYNLELEEHISFHQIINASDYDNKYIKELYSNTASSEKVWMDLHYNFTFRKKGSMDSYNNLFVTDSKTVKTTQLLKPVKTPKVTKTIKPIKTIKPVKPTK